MLKSVNLAWNPWKVPLRWCDKPEDVPFFDVSRGFPLFTSFWWGDEESFPFWEKILIRNSIKEFIHGKAWYPTPQVVLPRLVRCNPLDDADSSIVKTNDQCLNELSVLTRYADYKDIYSSKKIRDQIVKLNNRYGLIGDPQDPKSYEIDKWISVAKVVQANIDAMNALDIEGSLEKFKDYAWEMVQKYANSVGNNTQNMESDLLKQEWFNIWFKASLNCPSTPKAFRQNIAAQGGAILNASGTGELNIAKGTIVYNAPLEVWIRFKLAQAWLIPRITKHCTGCGRAFIAYNPSRVTCLNGCRGLKYSRKTRLST